MNAQFALLVHTFQSGLEADPSSPEPSKRLKIIIDTNWNKYVAFWELINSSINNHSTVSQTEINTLNELIPVTPTIATETISNDINTLTNQINRMTYSPTQGYGVSCYKSNFS